MPQTQKLPEKFGSRFRKKAEGPPRPSLLERKEAWQNWGKQKRLMQKQVMDDLIKLYGLQNMALPLVHLAWKLAEDFIPAMQYKEKLGAKEKWTTEKLMALTILVDRTKKKYEGKDLAKEIFYLVRTEAKGSILEPLLSGKITDKTLQAHYTDFLQSDEYRLIEKLKPPLSAPEAKEKWENSILYETDDNFSE